MEKCPRTGGKTVSTKIPARLLAELDRFALDRGVSRSFLIRELIEALLDGRVVMRAPPRRHELTIGQFFASDVAVAARKQAQRVAEAACRDGKMNPNVTETAYNVEEVVRRAVRLLEEGR
jgi:hypothetical protein